MRIYNSFWKDTQYFIKRVFDFCFAIVLFVITFPILLFGMILVKVNSPKESVFFSQIRSGYKGKQFKIYKLRSMTNDKDANGDYLDDSIRLKSWGKFIRKTNIDELPQILNIIKGEMSLIGPRPVLPVDVNKFNQNQLHRQDVLPGISGWEAVNEWKTPTWEKKFEYDIFYVDHFSLWLDIKIFFLTIYVILFAKRPGDDYRPSRFLGNDIEEICETREEKS